jgi:hypothetical protein
MPRITPVAPAFAVLGLFISAGCVSCPEPPEVSRMVGFDLATPESALEYFREAVRRDDAFHEYLVISEAYKRKVEESPNGVKLSFSNYVLGREQVKDKLMEIGSLDSIEIGEAVMHRRLKDVAIVTLSASGSTRRVKVAMVLETGYSVYWTDPLVAPTHVTLPQGANPVSVKGKEVVVRLALDENPGLTADQVHRITVERDWKILDFQDTDLTRQIGRVIREAQDGEKPAPEPRP